MLVLKAMLRSYSNACVMRSFGARRYLWGGSDGRKIVDEQAMHCQMGVDSYAVLSDDSIWQNLVTRDKTRQIGRCAFP